MIHVRVMDKDGKKLGTVMGKNLDDCLQRAKRRNSSAHSCGERLPDVHVQGEVTVRQSEYAEQRVAENVARVKDPNKA